MMLRSIVAGLALATTLSGTAAAVSLTNVEVSGRAEIFYALQPFQQPTFLPPGSRPVDVAFTAGAGQVLTVSNVTGLVDCCSLVQGPASTTPDGLNGPFSGTGTNITDSLGIAGMIAPGTQFLAGVFVRSADRFAPGDARDFNLPAGVPRLDYTQQGGISTSDETFAPLLNQTFFIGDGLTGAGTGTQQRFLVPDDADILVLGVLDSNAFNGPPGLYGDNSGAFFADVEIGTPTTVIPLAPAGALMLTALGVLGFAARRRAS